MTTEMKVEEFVDIEPTWADVCLLIVRLAVSGEVKAIEAMRPDIAKAFAAAEAIK